MMQDPRVYIHKSPSGFILMRKQAVYVYMFEKTRPLKVNPKPWWCLQEKADSHNRGQSNPFSTLLIAASFVLSIPKVPPLGLLEQKV